MRKERKEIVIEEIKYWRKSKLLPEHYCDFLLTLYTEGKEIESPKSSKKYLIPIVMVYAMFLLTVLIFYFTQFALLMQTTIAIIFTFAILMVAKQTEKQSLLLARLFQFMAAIILYLLTIQFSLLFLEDQNLALGLTTFIHSLAWILIGWKVKVRLFFIAGAIAFLLGVMVLIR